MKIKDNLANEFDEFSKNYTEDMIGCVPYYLNLMSCFLEGLPKNFTPTNVLDLGCGNGNVTARLLGLFPNARYALLDASEGMLNLCKKQFEKYDMEYVASYFQDYSFKNDTYDLIVAGFSLHHCNSDEKRSLFKKIHNSLKSRGVFSCSDLMIRKDSAEHPKLIEQWKSHVLKNFPDENKWEWLMEHYGEFDKPDHHKEQITWLKNAGFETIKITSFENYWVHFKAFKN